MVKPVEDANALKFFKSVFDSERDALVEKITTLSNSISESDSEHGLQKEIVGNLKVRLKLIAEYEISDPAGFLIHTGQDKFICPRCLVHNSSETLLTLDVILGSGKEGEWRCRSCGLHYSPITNNHIPFPHVPIPSI